MSSTTLIMVLSLATLLLAFGVGVLGRRGGKRAKDGAADDSALARHAEVSRDPSDKLFTPQPREVPKR
jgi:hypothetical protein